MSLIQVTKDFVLTLEDGTTRAFKKGEHEVEDEIAKHWYVQAHSKPVEAEAVQEATSPQQESESENASGPKRPIEETGSDQPYGSEQPSGSVPEPSTPSKRNKGK